MKKIKKVIVFLIPRSNTKLTCNMLTYSGDKYICFTKSKVISKRKMIFGYIYVKLSPLSIDFDLE